MTSAYGEVRHHDECVSVILATIRAIEIYAARALDIEVRARLEQLRRERDEEHRS